MGRFEEDLSQRSDIHLMLHHASVLMPEEAPFDRIIVTAVEPDIPGSLVEQLKTGGRMVLPVGTQYSAQNLTVMTKQADGGYTTEEVLPVAFVPLTGDH